jgi:hypothetical protein
MEKKTPDDAGPAGSPLLLGGTKRGTSSMRIPVSGTRYADVPNIFIAPFLN